ncbi:hypothetical protein VE25_18005 [Devosia geojensis]|uniref:Uncharacterized protein n=1 Tax=Devosia geojensis TaxID=443610 RepID=A0A0F5FQH2_9HYPH|nr:hypothetical protein [Devosia geojensis]KKB10442.1 hypothetical protein VE25_18005 [Devosia geojensis]
MWHAYTNDDLFGHGTAILITGGALPVSIGPGDTVAIETPTGRRLVVATAIEGDSGMTLTDKQGINLVLLRIEESPAFEDFKLSDGFSRQVWIIERCEDT